MSDLEAIESFIGKWRARWPEWSVAEVFVPQAQRELSLAWWALLQELTDAAWGGSDPRPGEAKLGWWMEELQGWSHGARRHPLGAVLQKHAAAWPVLAASLPSLRESRERPVDAHDARMQLREFTEAVASIEQSLFGTGTGAAEAVAASLLQMRLAHHPESAAPLQVLAQAGEAGALAEWTRQLASQGTATRDAALPRRLLAGLARARLQRDQPARPVPAIRSLWTSWRAARG